MTDKQTEQTQKRIGQRIYQLRTMRGWNQDKLAQEAGLQRSHISCIESGKHNGRVGTIEAIAQALGMTVDIVDPRLSGLVPTTLLT